MSAVTGVEMKAALSGLTTTLTHGPSGTVLRTVPPVDNGGDGSSFSPTDLVGAALAACAITTMALVAKRDGLPFGAASAHVEKRMTSAPRRIGELVLRITMPAEVQAPDHRARLEEVARTCPVAKSLHPDLKLPIDFQYP